MSFSFNTSQGLVVVRAQLTGSSGTAVIRPALGTIATRTLINASLLVAVGGYDPAATLERAVATTGSGMAFAASVSVSKIAALGREVSNRRDAPHSPKVPAP